MSVYKAINAVQKTMAGTGISKGQFNKYDKYSFRGIDDVYNALGPALAEAGLVILPRVTERQVQERPTQKGGTQMAVTLQVEFDFIAAEDGSKHTVVAFGEAMDRGDKATPKAMAAAYKYMAFQAFCIPVDGQPDADQETHRIERAPAQPKQQPTVPASPAVDPDALIADTQAAWIKKTLQATSADVAKFCAHFQVPSVDALKTSQLPTVKQAITAKKTQVATAATLNDKVK
jgi:hypothetical protein